MKFFFLLFTVTALCFAAGAGNTALWQPMGGSYVNAPEVTVVESGITHLVLEITVSGFQTSEYPAGGSTWNRITLPECNYLGDVGNPELPAIPVMFALPFETNAVVTLEDMQTLSFDGFRVLPAQTPEIDMIHAPYAFRINNDIYQGSETYSTEIVYVDNEANWAGLNIARLVVNPFTWNPASGELTAATTITVRIDFEGTPGIIAAPVNPAMAPVMTESIINWKTFESYTQPVDGQRNGVEYVFICNEGNVEAVEDLIKTHHITGLQCTVETLSNPATTSAIKAAITDNYDTGVTRFAMIVGTHSEMPSYYWDGQTGDYWYACLVGTDLMPEIAVGRLTGTSTQIAHQVDKIIGGYMEYNFDDGNETGITPSETVLAAHSEQYPYKYTQCCNEIAAYPYTLCDVTFTKVYPPEGGTASMVSDAINNGIGTVGYRGHGDVTYWSWSPGWNSSNINALTNTFMPPVFNIACYCGDYMGSGDCLSESWQFADNGASGNLGATDPSYTDANHDYMKQMYIGTYDTGLYRMGESISAATVYIVNNHSSYGEANARMYIWFGDPAQDIWTFDTADEPLSLDISAPGQINPGTQDVTITVTADGIPVENVLVTLTDGYNINSDAMTFYEQGNTDSNGEATLNITVIENDVVWVGAYLHDYNYDIDSVLVMTGIENAGGLIAEFEVGMITPNPVSSTASLNYSLPASGMVDIAVYDIAGHRVQTILNDEITAGEHVLEWTPVENIANGVYFIKFSNEAHTVSRRALVIR